MRENKIAIQSCTWKEVRAEIQPVNPLLTRIIDNIDPGNAFKLYRVKYPYGCEYVQQGLFYLPTEQGYLVKLNDPIVPNNIQEALSYSFGTNPAFIQLKKTSELYITLSDRIITYTIFREGDTVGFSGVLDWGNFGGVEPDKSYTPVSTWQMSSGARSVFLLPKITENRSHKRVQNALGTVIESPRSYVDHWQVFKLLPKTECDWHSELLLFGRDWVEALNTPAFIELKCYLLEMYRKSFIFWSNIFTWNLTFAQIYAKRNLKISLDQFDTVKQVFAIATGSVPGHRPAIDEALAPVKAIQQMYTDVYRLNQLPVLMEPANFKVIDDRPIYYSLHFPTIEYDLDSKISTSTISDLWNIEYIIEKYIHDILYENLNIETTPLYTVTESSVFDFYHTMIDAKRYPNIKSSQDLLAEDAGFSQCLYCSSAQGSPLNSSFLKGVVRVKSK